MPAPLKDLNVIVYSSVYHAVYVLPGRGDAVFLEEYTLREPIGMDAMAQLGVSVLKARGRQDGAGVELTHRFVGKPNDGAVLRAAMTLTASVLGGDAPGGMDHEATLTLPSQRSITF